MNISSLQLTSPQTYEQRLWELQRRGNIVEELPNHHFESLSRAFGAAKDNTAKHSAFHTNDTASSTKDGTSNPGTKKAQHSFF